jgi:hypothetical protein
LRIHPPVSIEEALEWLKRQAEVEWGVESTLELEALLRPTAEAMAAVSDVVLPETVEPFP